MFVDESGDLAHLPIGPSTAQPVLSIAGLMVPQSHVANLTREWVNLKRRFFPGLCSSGSKHLDWHRAEVKGSEIRKLFRTQSSRSERRHALGFLDKTLGLIESHSCKYSARVWVKEPGIAFKGSACYAFSVQALCADFQKKLEFENTSGLVIADSRMPGPNSLVSHSVFTQKYRAAGDPYARILEAPLFGHSDNHAGLQLADMIASALLFPICSHFFLNGKIQNSHIGADYPTLGRRYIEQIKRLQFRYGSANGLSGGLVVSDPVGKSSASRLFQYYGNLAPNSIVGSPSEDTQMGIPKTPPAIAPIEQTISFPESPSA